MKSIVYQGVRFLRRTLWAIVVAYMLGLHNVYQQEDKTVDDILITIEEEAAQEDSSPKD